jgi:YgiT-type zinc finger domain-containing protein
MANYTENQECPVCGHGTLTRRVFTETFEYDSQTCHIENYETYKCSNCKEELVSEESLERSGKILKKWLDEIKSKDKTSIHSEAIRSTYEKLSKLSPEEFKAELDKHVDGDIAKMLIETGAINLISEDFKERSKK